MAEMAGGTGRLGAGENTEVVTMPVSEKPATFVA